MEDYQWFVLHTYSSHEKRVREAIDHSVRMEGLSDLVRKVEIPTRKASQVRGKNKVEVDKVVVPGYVLVEMIPTEELINLITGIRGVTGFLGVDKSTPTPISEYEVKAFLGVEEEGVEKKRVVVGLAVGDKVMVKEGFLGNSVGTITAIDNAHGKVTVNIIVFGRETPTVLDASQVEKTSDK